jgi:selenocysteine lyase/cysteine desulfurase
LFQHAERKNLQPLLDFLAQRSNLRLIGKAITRKRAPTVAFTVEGREPALIAALLAAQKIGIANGNCYAYRLMQALGIPPQQGVVRLSFVHYTSKEEVSRLMDALDKIL